MSKRVRFIFGGVIRIVWILTWLGRFAAKVGLEERTKLICFIWWVYIVCFICSHYRGFEQKSKPTVSQTLPLPNFNKLLRATFKVNDNEIKKLKGFSMIKNPSTFVVVGAHLWTSMARSDMVVADANDEPYYLGSPIDCRRRLVPPLPENYCNICVMPLIAVSTRETLRGNGGFAAVEAVVATIKVVGKSMRVSEFFNNRSETVSELIGKKVV